MEKIEFESFEEVREGLYSVATSPELTLGATLDNRTSIGTLSSNNEGASKIIEADPSTQARVNAIRKTRSRTMAMYCQSSLICGKRAKIERSTHTASNRISNLIMSPIDFEIVE